MTASTGQMLGLTEIDAVQRAHYSAFAMKFAPVTIKGSRLLYSYGSNKKKTAAGQDQAGSARHV
jgi:hypothetical protein